MTKFTAQASRYWTNNDWLAAGFPRSPWDCGLGGSVVPRVAPFDLPQPPPPSDDEGTYQFRGSASVCAGFACAVSRLPWSEPEKDSRKLLDGLCQWLLHRFGPDSPEGREALCRMAVDASAADEAVKRGVTQADEDAAVSALREQPYVVAQKANWTGMALHFARHRLAALASNAPDAAKREDRA